MEKEEDLERFTEFLKSVDLDDYRGKYRQTKIVEMDLPKEIQAIALLYNVYWEEKQFVSFDEFYNRYLEDKKALLEDFRNKIGMCDICFYKGLPARIYRTWASLITQIHAGYVADVVFNEGIVNMSEDLDHSGADFQIVAGKKILNFQVKKETQSREVRAEKKSKRKIKGKFITIKYEVPNFDDIKNNQKKDGNFKAGYKRFYNKYLKKKLLRVLDNGFVIFEKNYFIPFKKFIK